ncbi:dienelactone hydrolase family protein [Sphingomonas mesophila]|uniref:dienelactone hydrolase family protein n=1 Tax=Sphingomonas mesophila TaxID=2303576 RepID=UPI000E56CA42|nr:dienelactone hydrolase family protein [Sphingomonas mesophila]
MSNRTDHSHSFDGVTLSHLALDDGGGAARPGVVIFPSVMNRGPVEEDHGARLVALGYSVVLADTFGAELIGRDRDTMFGEMNRHLDDRLAYVKRLAAILGFARALPAVDGSRMAVMGFCFGGLCALDLARSGADFQVAAVFHGLLKPPNFETARIVPKVAAFHGWDDPMAPPEDVVALGQELTAAGCDWQVHAYGNVAHGFTNPAAHELNVPGVTYNQVAAARSWDSFTDLLAETLR